VRKEWPSQADIEILLAHGNFPSRKNFRGSTRELLPKWRCVGDFESADPESIRALSYSEAIAAGTKDGTAPEHRFFT
jgi:hypothetical protein